MRVTAAKNVQAMRARKLRRRRGCINVGDDDGGGGDNDGNAYGGCGTFHAAPPTVHARTRRLQTPTNTKTKTRSKTKIAKLKSIIHSKRSYVAGGGVALGSSK
jgi:hypothetical protein